MFVDDVCVDILGVLDGRSYYANITFLGLFAKPCVGRPEVMLNRPDYAAALLSEFYAGARCPPMLAPSWRCSGQGIWLGEGGPSSKASLESLQVKRLWRAFKRSASVSSFSSTFFSSFSSSFHLFLCFLAIILV